MTFHEKQEYIILGILIKAGNKRISDAQINNLFHDQFGAGYSEIREKMQRSSLIKQYKDPFEWEVTKTGYIKYNELKKERRAVNVKNAVMWATLGLALLSVIFTYFDCKFNKSTNASKNESKPLLQKDQRLSIIPRPQTKRPDTIKVHLKSLLPPDTLNIVHRYRNPFSY